MIFGIVLTFPWPARYFFNFTMYLCFATTRYIVYSDSILRFFHYNF